MGVLFTLSGEQAHPILGDAAAERLGLRNLPEWDSAVPADRDVVDGLGPTDRGVWVPQRDGGQIFEKDLLDLLINFYSLFGGAGRCLVDEGVDLWVGVVGIVVAGAGAVQGADKGAGGRIVGGSAGTGYPQTRCPGRS